MAELYDQTGRIVSLPQPAKRIISLVPSITELLYDLGLDDEVVGITKFCVHPLQWFKNKTRIGGTKTIDIEKIKSLSPDLIIANKEENVKEQVDAIAIDCPVYTSDINDLDSALQMIADIGLLTGREIESSALIQKIKNAFASIPIPSMRPRVCYFIWQKPFMTAGGDTFINDMLERCGFQNIFTDHVRYPVVELQQLAWLNCKHILLSSEPFPFREKHVAAIKTALIDSMSSSPGFSIPQIQLVDGEMFSWYGSRLLPAAEYFKRLREILFPG